MTVNNINTTFFIDKLDAMFHMRERFMAALRDVDESNYPEWPIDISDKKSQQYIRDIALRGVEELFEALQHLKNWKPHRVTENKSFNKDAFVEEFVDALNYFLSVLVLMGVSSDQLYNSYKVKDSIIHKRIDSGY